MMIEALENMDEGIIVSGQVVSDVRFADDQGLKVWQQVLKTACKS